MKSFFIGVLFQCGGHLGGGKTPVNLFYVYLPGNFNTASAGPHALSDAYPGRCKPGSNSTIMALSKFIFRVFSGLLSAKRIYLVKSLTYRNKPQQLPVNFDYIRYSTLGLCYEELMANNVKGNVAELGVYRGDFSKRLNRLFSNRKIYLFDTFEGFHSKDVDIERQRSFSEGNQDFSDTSVEMVLQKMPYPGNCIVKKGFFPATAVGIEDTFCFVSLDADLYEPIYQGLLFFYPRMEKGGYLFIHDFNNESYKGAREAVIRFCQEHNAGYVPVPDSGGTVIITR